MELVEPHALYEKHFAAFYNDFLHNDPENAEYYSQGYEDFVKYIKRLIDESNGINLRLDYVPCSHFWLTNETKQIIGAVRIRHHIENEFLALEAGHIGYDVAPSFRGKGYGKLMLKMAVAKAKSMGIERALVTADDNNWASRKVIEANGGQFEKIIIGKVFPNPIARYWIDCV